MDRHWQSLYDADKTLGHREFWALIRAEVRAEMQASPEPEVPMSQQIDIDSLSEAELELLTRPEVTQ